ncbi:energy-coupling factor transporter ATPase [Brevibacillus porteri]|uniref:Energy-coupling factor transporter ATPase n=1 Tax=Brevibacillus porteri TaxID=2126350 RepID=A0ABX5FJ04_9BACL|nr:energy-coupling factor transporter ATPase [Brevibacillus porteri]MED1800102.1 energy-coupling factor transporter ATPase [Brevibacillus porteri]MED2134512.1 energy-coupling factor transporter ATPase [Brevibacillus porteri]MED2747163.1 energy-coupling factor transporter ATPase [Brevibacillus porteri]MED2812473.1 energy-coupling factor transporter ATPase [Brevibacillus porteri]MED4896548.1 energy-coupling factor transporter ATPase [Brevibacillus porteri]
MTPQPIIRVENVSFAYQVNQDQQIPVLQNVSLEVFPGEYVAIIGHNGSGKSTLSKHLNGILTPNDGDVIVNGINTREKQRIHEVRSRVGMVFQHPDNQIVATIVEDDVAFGLENIGTSAEEMKTRVDFALEAVGMSAFRHRPPHHLSGGQKQRIAIAGILAMKPQCLVMDEATSMLDSYGRQDILAVVRKLHREGMTIVTVTHHMSEVAEADRVIVMEGGKIVLEGTPREVFSHQERLRELHLDVPDASRIAHLVHSEYHEFTPDLIHNAEVVAEVNRLYVRQAEASGS